MEAAVAGISPQRVAMTRVASNKVRAAVVPFTARTRKSNQVMAAMIPSVAARCAALKISARGSGSTSPLDYSNQTEPASSPWNNPLPHGRGSATRWAFVVMVRLAGFSPGELAVTRI